MRHKYLYKLHLITLRWELITSDPIAIKTKCGLKGVSQEFMVTTPIYLFTVCPSPSSARQEDYFLNCVYMLSYAGIY